ncbi:MAG: hypothetical protein ACNA8W_05060 [Bradymonadaceae bacterium]
MMHLKYGSLGVFLCLGLLLGGLSACTFEAGEPVAVESNSGWDLGGSFDAADSSSTDATGPGPDEVSAGPEDTSAPSTDTSGLDGENGGEADTVQGPDAEPDAEIDAEPDTGPVLECGGNAVDTTRDPLHCGSCDNACAAGERCVNSHCECRPDLTRCDGECVDTERNPMYCGSCTMNCGFGRCNNGSCGAGGCSGRISCEQGDGLACIALNELNHPLYCAPSFSEACGEECAGDEICARAGTVTLRCRTVRPGLGCTECPCDHCEDGERCVEDPDGMTGIFCLDR